MVKIDFEFVMHYGEFCDALHFYDDVVPPDENCPHRFEPDAQPLPPAPHPRGFLF
jgi:hypothetical protein